MYFARGSSLHVAVSMEGGGPACSTGTPLGHRGEVLRSAQRRRAGRHPQGAPELSTHRPTGRHVHGCRGASRRSTSGLPTRVPLPLGWPPGRPGPMHQRRSGPPPIADPEMAQQTFVPLPWGPSIDIKPRKASPRVSLLGDANPYLWTWPRSTHTAGLFSLLRFLTVHEAEDGRWVTPIS